MTKQSKRKKTIVLDFQQWIKVNRDLESKYKADEVIMKTLENRVGRGY